MSGSGADLMKREKDRARAILARMEGDGEPASEPVPAPAAWTPPTPPRPSSPIKPSAAEVDVARLLALLRSGNLPPLPGADEEYDAAAEAAQLGAVAEQLVPLEDTCGADASLSQAATQAGGAPWSCASSENSVSDSPWPNGNSAVPLKYLYVRPGATLMS